MSRALEDRDESLSVTSLSSDEESSEDPVTLTFYRTDGTSATTQFLDWYRGGLTPSSYEVEELLGIMIRPGAVNSLTYQIKWKGCPQEHQNTWQPLAHLENANIITQRFHIVVRPYLEALLDQINENVPEIPIVSAARGTVDTVKENGSAAHPGAGKASATEELRSKNQSTPLHRIAAAKRRKFYELGHNQHP